MSLTISLGVYFICWWLVWFAVLPFAAKTGVGDQNFDYNDPKPVTPKLNLWQLAAITTAISALIFTLIYIVIENRWITLDSFPI